MNKAKKIQLYTKCKSQDVEEVPMNKECHRKRICRTAPATSGVVKSENIEY